MYHGGNLRNRIGSYTDNDSPLPFVVRVASSNKDSLSMEYQRRRMGPYKAIGSMNDKLVN